MKVIRHAIAMGMMTATPRDEFVVAAAVVVAVGWRVEVDVRIWMSKVVVVVVVVGTGRFVVVLRVVVEATVVVDLAVVFVRGLGGGRGVG